jgi:hypothetical protein
LHIFRHLAQKSFDRRQPACTIFAQSNKKSDCASAAQSLCGVAYRKAASTVAEHRYSLFKLKK